SQSVLNRREISTWDALSAELVRAADQWRNSHGAGLRILSRHETSPTFLDQIGRLLAKYPAAKWHEYEPLGTSKMSAIYHLDKAQVIVSLGDDFLGSGPATLKYGRDFATGRSPGVA